jgi:hypothetical protein
MPELLIVDAVTDGTNTSGAAALNSDIFQASPTNGIFRLPTQTKARIFNYQASGKAAIFNLQFSNDVTAGSPTWTTVDSVDLAAEGIAFQDPGTSRPVILHSSTGKEGFRVSWTQSVAGVSHFSFNLEIGSYEEESYD